MSVRSDLFTYVVGQCRGGALQDELSEAINACVTRAQETGKQAVLTLSIKIKPNGGSGQYHLIDEIKSKLPALDKGASIFFGTPDGNLQRTDPNQREMELASVADDRPKTFEKAN
jgi:hypothetical protein